MEEGLVDITFERLQDTGEDIIVQRTLDTGFDKAFDKNGNWADTYKKYKMDGTEEWSSSCETVTSSVEEESVGADSSENNSENNTKTVANSTSTTGLDTSELACTFHESENLQGFGKLKERFITIIDNNNNNAEPKYVGMVSPGHLCDNKDKTYLEIGAVAMKTLGDSTTSDRGSEKMVLVNNETSSHFHKAAETFEIEEIGMTDDTENDTEQSEYVDESFAHHMDVDQTLLSESEQEVLQQNISERESSDENLDVPMYNYILGLQTDDMNESSASGGMKSVNESIESTNVCFENEESAQSGNEFIKKVAEVCGVKERTLNQSASFSKLNPVGNMGIRSERMNANTYDIAAHDNTVDVISENNEVVVSEKKAAKRVSLDKDNDADVVELNEHNDTNEVKLSEHDDANRIGENEHDTNGTEQNEHNVSDVIEQSGHHFAMRGVVSKHSNEKDYNAPACVEPSIHNDVVHKEQIHANADSLRKQSDTDVVEQKEVKQNQKDSSIDSGQDTFLEKTTEQQSNSKDKLVETTVKVSEYNEKIFNDVNIQGQSMISCETEQRGNDNDKADSSINGSRNLSTPDSDLQRISPEVFHMTHFSPTEVYGKEHATDYQRCSCRPAPPSLKPDSTLNTPEPILYEDTYSDGSAWINSNRFCHEYAENPLQETCSQPPAGNKVVVLANEATDSDNCVRGMKRNFDYLTGEDYFTTSQNLYIPVPSVTSYINQGRPPDISTWTAVCSASSTQQVESVYSDNSAPWNKPTCTVPPYLQNTSYKGPVVNTGYWSNNKHIANVQSARQIHMGGPMHYSSSTYADHLNNNSSQHLGTNYNHGACNYSRQQYSMPYQMSIKNVPLDNAYQNRTVIAGAQRSCQYNMSCARPRHVHHPVPTPSSAAYKLDFSSPAGFTDQAPVLNFVSNQSHLSENVSRPIPVLASNRQAAAMYFNNVTVNHQVDDGTPQPPSLLTVPPPVSVNFDISNSHHRDTSLWTRSNVQMPEPEFTAVRLDIDGKEIRTEIENGNSNVRVNVTAAVRSDENKNGNNREDTEKCVLEIPNMAAAAEHTASSGQNTSQVDITFNADTIQMNCEMQESSNQDKIENGMENSKYQGPKFEADSTTIDLTHDSGREVSSRNETTAVQSDRADVQSNDSTSVEVCSDSQVLVKKKRPFTEIYMRKGQKLPTGNANSALDLSKKEARTSEAHSSAVVLAPQNRQPTYQPIVPVSIFLNNMTGPALAYSGASLIPYMNSIFTAMTNYKKGQGTSQLPGLPSTAVPKVSVSMCTTDNTVTQHSAGEVTENQSSLRQQQVQPVQTEGNSGMFMLQNKQTIQRRGNVQLQRPRVNLSSLPLPLYAAPLQCPIQPLLPVMNYGLTQHRLFNPFLCKLNIGYAMQPSISSSSTSHPVYMPAQNLGVALPTDLGATIPTANGVTMPPASGVAIPSATCVTMPTVTGVTMPTSTCAAMPSATCVTMPTVSGVTMPTSTSLTMPTVSGVGKKTTGPGSTLTNAQGVTMEVSQDVSMSSNCEFVERNSIATTTSVENVSSENSGAAIENDGNSMRSDHDMHIDNVTNEVNNNGDIRTVNEDLSEMKELLLNKKKRQNKVERKEKAIAPALCPPDNRMPAYNQVCMNIQGKTYTTVPVATRGLVTYKAIPGSCRSRAPPDPNKTFKARHFNFTQLTIGSYKYTVETFGHEKTARVKLLFGKKYMAYEFQLNGDSYSRPCLKQMAEIIVPFNSIVALWLFERDMRVEVNTVPKVCIGSKGIEKNSSNRIGVATVYNRKTNVDVTQNQVAKSPYHHIQFKSMCVEKIRSELCGFDQRFCTLLRQPLIEDPSRTLEPGPRQIVNKLLDPTIQLPPDHNNNFAPVYQPTSYPAPGSSQPQAQVSCGCTAGCSDASCACCVKGVTCTEGVCGCISCRNPLNVLHQLGLPAAQARTDPCLMENIYQIHRLDCYVKMQLMLECCHIPMLLFNCVPGEKKCPNSSCQARYKYSWCTAQLCNEDVMPRNHCLKCGRCTDYRNSHCETCNICYFSGVSKTFKCPICHNGESQSQDDSFTDSDQAE